MPATVLTERLLLRRWRVDDAAPLAEIYSQPEYLATMPPAAAVEQIPMWERRWDEDGFAPWAACVRGSGRLIGRIGLLRHHDWPLEPDVVEVGWVLHRDFWGRGLATEGGRVSIAIWRSTSPTTASTVSRCPRTCGHSPSWSASGCVSVVGRPGAASSTSGTSSTAAKP